MAEEPAIRLYVMPIGILLVTEYNNSNYFYVID